MNWWLKCTWLTQHSPCFHLTNPCCVSDSEWLSRWYDVFVSILFIYYHNTFNDNCGPSSAKYKNVLCIFAIFSFEDDEAHDCYNLESMRTEHWTAHIIFSRIACYSVLSKYRVFFLWCAVHFSSDFVLSATADEPAPAGWPFAAKLTALDSKPPPTKK